VAWAIVAVADPIGIPAIQANSKKESRLPRPPQLAQHRSGKGTSAVVLGKNLFSETQGHLLWRNQQSLPPKPEGSAIRLASP
jgi:hypothetical protein